MPEQLPQQPQAAPTPQAPPQEKLEFLKREEVRTMAKDIAKTREQEAGKRRERVATLQPQAAHTPYTPFKAAPLQPQQVVQPQSVPQQQPVAQPEPASSLMPSRRSPSKIEKVFVRIVVAGVIVFALLNVVALIVWLYF